MNAAERASGRQVQAVLRLLDRGEAGGTSPGLGRVELLRAVRAALAVAPVPVRTADGSVGTAEAVAFQAGQAAALAAVRAAAELAWAAAPSSSTTGDAQPAPPQRAALGGEPERAMLRAAVRAVLAVVPFPLRATGGGGVGEQVARAFDAGQRAALGGVATAVGVALRPDHPGHSAHPARHDPPGCRGDERRRASQARMTA